LEKIIYEFFVNCGEESLPDKIDLKGVEIIGWDKIWDNWWKLKIRLPRDMLTNVAEYLKKQGIRLARSANY